MKAKWQRRGAGMRRAEARWKEPESPGARGRAAPSLGGSPSSPGGLPPPPGVPGGVPPLREAAPGSGCSARDFGVFSSRTGAFCGPAAGWHRLPSRSEPSPLPAGTPGRQPEEDSAAFGPAAGTGAGSTRGDRFN